MAAVKIVLSFLALFIVIRGIDTQKTLMLFRQSNILWWMPAILMFILSKYISALRLNTFLQCSGVRLNTNTNIKLYLLGMYYNLFLPGGIGGDAYKIWYINKQYQGKTKNTFIAILLDRITGLLALIIMAFLLSTWVNLPLQAKYIMWASVPLAIPAYFFVIAYYFSSWKKIFISSNIQSLWVQIAQLVSALFILMAMGMPADPLPYFFLFLVSGIIAVIPFTVGGAGARELTFFLGSQWLNLDMELSIALSLGFYLITAIVSLSGVYYSLFPVKINPHKMS